MAKLALHGGAPVREKPFPKWPVWGDEEIANLTEVVKSGKWGSLAGTKVKEFEQKFADYQQARFGICVNSGTTALRIALMAAGVESGQEVLVPNYTFIASATAVLEAGAIPVFVDVESDTYNMDPEVLEQHVTPRTAALMPVHFAGRPADMDRIMAFAQKHALKVVEDACQAWGSEWDGRRVGAIGDAGAFSFQSSKNINAGEGGIITTNDPEIDKMARAHANCGRSADGQWYEHFYYGGNFRMTEFQAAVLLAQLGRLDELQAIRHENAAYLDEKLSTIPGVEPLANPTKATRQSHHLYIFRYRKEEFAGAPKARFIEALRKEGIPCSPGYSLPLNRQPVFLRKSFGPRGKTVPLPVEYSAVHTPVTERACYEEAVWFTQNMLLGTRDDMADIVEAIAKIKEHAREL
ncbi:MAG: DegT/DnrJ/EryC1/StrS family aminotransferase [candidate division KSB1 bacterium]|nr:DegT/DnrJ/EryC1/StrS family aminotransferase [candidate division KSB1 bacterium]